MAGLLIDLQIAEIAEKTVQKIPHVLNDSDSGNWFSFSFILNEIQWKLGKQLFTIEKDLIASVCNRLIDVIIGYMEKASLHVYWRNSPRFKVPRPSNNPSWLYTYCHTTSYWLKWLVLPLLVSHNENPKKFWLWNKILYRIAL